MDYKDYYKTLGVSRSATADEIKRAYRKLAREFHPDKNKAKGAEDKFKEINEANEVLSDDGKRKMYDQLGANWKAGQQFRPPPGWEGHFRSRARGPRMGAQGNQDFGGFSDFFSTLFGGAMGGAGTQGSPFGAGGFDMGDAYAEAEDTRASVSISLEDSYNGATREMQVGSRTLKVRIPKGVTGGQTIRLAQQGARGGDLLLEIQFLLHPTFTVEGRDVHCTVSIAPWEAALGGPVPVPTLGGTVELNLPANTQGGKKMRLKGRGLPGATPGDQFVTLNIVTPPAQIDTDKEFYKEMSRRFGFDPRKKQA